MSNKNIWDDVKTYPDLADANSLCLRFCKDRSRSGYAVVAAVTRKIYTNDNDKYDDGCKQLYQVAEVKHTHKWHERRALLLKHLNGSKEVWYYRHGLTCPYHNMQVSHESTIKQWRNTQRKEEYRNIPTVQF